MELAEQSEIAKNCEVFQVQRLLSPHNPPQRKTRYENEWMTNKISEMLAGLNKVEHCILGATIAWGLPPQVTYPGEAWDLPHDLISQFPFSIDSDVDPENNRNHGYRIYRPWVSSTQGSDCRYFWMGQHDPNTLIPIFENECAYGSMIHSYEWPAYSNLNTMGYQHSTANHQQHYVDSGTGAHTQANERSWLDAKMMILKRMWAVLVISCSNLVWIIFAGRWWEKFPMIYLCHS